MTDQHQPDPAAELARETAWQMIARNPAGLPEGLAEDLAARRATEPATATDPGLLERARDRALGPEVPCSGCGWTWSRRFDPEVARKGAMCRQYHRGDGRPLGEAGTTDPRAALIRTDPGRHAANRGPTFITEPETGGAVLPEGWTTMNLGPGNGWQPPAGTRIPAALIHRCPEPPESHEGWWASVGLAAGFLLASLAWWVVLTW